MAKWASWLGTLITFGGDPELVDDARVASVFEGFGLERDVGVLGFVALRELAERILTGGKGASGDNRV